MPKNENLQIEESMIDTVLAVDINFQGVLNFSESLMIKGKFTGEIDASGHLIIAPGASVKATVKAGVITNYGDIKGNVTATERLEMFSDAVLNGDAETPELFIETGCQFNGNCKMTEKPKHPKPESSSSVEETDQKKKK